MPESCRGSLLGNLEFNLVDTGAHIGVLDGAHIGVLDAGSGGGDVADIGAGIGVGAGTVSAALGLGAGIGSGGGDVGVGIGIGGNGGGGNGGNPGGGGGGNGGNPGGGGNGGNPGGGGNGGNPGGGIGGTPDTDGGIGRAVALCTGPNGDQVASIVRTRIYNAQTIASWHQASNVQVVPVKLCPEVRGTVTQAIKANDTAALMQSAVQSDPLMSASLGRTTYNASNVLAVEQSSGDTVRVFVY